MSKYFNEYGNIIPNSEMDIVRKKVEKIISHFVEDMVDNGASYLELRAFGQIISSSADFSVVMGMLDKEMKQREQREKSSSRVDIK